MASALVFAYHNVGVRCLRVLLDAGIEVRSVVTHADNPNEAIWFGSVAAVAAEHGLACIAPADPNAPEFVAQLRALAPDFVFSFYYRQMLGAPLLELARRGAYNLHGSLLPRYRGRAPVNWAILHGEREAGATLHAMQLKPDAGAIVDQMAVPILGDDSAREVFDKVTLAAEIVLARSLPGLVDGSAVLRPQQAIPGQYFGGRRPQDGLIPARAGAQQIHDLVRAVAPPEYPGAFFHARGHRVVIARTQRVAGLAGPQRARFALSAQGGHLWLDAADGARLRVLAATCDGTPLDAAGFGARFRGETLASEA